MFQWIPDVAVCDTIFAENKNFSIFGNKGVPLLHAISTTTSPSKYEKLGKTIRTARVQLPWMLIYWKIMMMKVNFPIKLNTAKLTSIAGPRRTAGRPSSDIDRGGRTIRCLFNCSSVANSFEILKASHDHCRKRTARAYYCPIVFTTLDPINVSYYIQSKMKMYVNTDLKKKKDKYLGRRISCRFRRIRI